jgi:uncharacterized protein YceK
MFRAFMVLLLVGGCATVTPYNTPYGGVTYGVPDAEVVVRQPELYTRAEIDAINAETQCRSLARSSLQAARCGVRR